MSRRIDVPSFGLGAALATCVGAVLWMRVTPPWRLGALLSSALKRHAWDASVALCERRARPGRRPLRLFLIRHGQSLANTRPHLVGGRDEASPLSERGEDEARRLGERLAREGVAFDRVFASHAARARRTAEIACGVAAAASVSASLGGGGGGGGLGEGEGEVEIEVEPRVVEFSQGALEMRPRGEVYAPGGPVRRGIERDGNLFFRPPGFSPDGARGESQYDTERRFAAFVDELLDCDDDEDDDAAAADQQRRQDGAAAARPPPPAAPRRDEERTIAVFSHGIAIRSFLRGVLGADAGFVVSTHTDNTSITELRYKPQPSDNMGGWQLLRFNDAAHLRHPEAEAATAGGVAQFRARH